MTRLYFMGIEMPDPHFVLVPVGRDGRYFAAVDEADWELVRWRRWSLQRTDGGNLYASTSLYKGPVGMHRFIMGCKDPTLVIDHRDGVGLNNRRYNLREATYRQNAMNRGPSIASVSGVHGVEWLQYRRLWRVRLRGRDFGCYREKSEAIRVCEAAEKEMFGEFARSSAVPHVPPLDMV